MRELIEILGEFIILILLIVFAVFSAVIVTLFLYGIFKAVINAIIRAFKGTNSSAGVIHNRNNDRS